MIRITFLLTLSLFSLACGVVIAKDNDMQPDNYHKTTNWDIRPSQAFDALCLLNTLTADSFYLGYYQSEYDRFAPKITPEARAALTDLKRKMKDENQQIISAFLCLAFSATDDSTLDDLSKTMENTSSMQAALKATPYYSDEDWKIFESVQPDLIIIFNFLRSIKFEDYWQREILPQIAVAIDSVRKELPKYNVIPDVEQMLGHPLSSDKITVYMLYYTQPHGIKVVGSRFITDVAWPFEIVIRTAVHEMMHPPYDLAGNLQLAQALDTLKHDDFFMDKVQHHNPSFGYNTPEGLLEEDCVQALDQIINEKLGPAKEAHQRWKENDDGIHVFAVALYQVLKEENYNNKNEEFADFLVRNIRSGKLAPGNIKNMYDNFYGGKQ